MDGSGFLRDLPALPAFDPSIVSRGGHDGILYVEDFDAPFQPPPPEADEAEPQPEAPAFTAADIETAYAAGREEGLRAALTEAALVQTQLHAAATQALADALAANRRALEHLASQQAQDTAQLLLAILNAAIPDTMAAYAEAELRAVIDAMLPGLRCEAELRVRTHPATADLIREILATHLAADGTVISVAADATLAEGDVQITWADGGARRDSARIYADIRAALAPLKLPSIEDLCCGKRD